MVIDPWDTMMTSDFTQGTRRSARVPDEDWMDDDSLARLGLTNVPRDEDLPDIDEPERQNPDSFYIPERQNPPNPDGFYMHDNPRIVGDTSVEGSLGVDGGLIVDGQIRAQDIDTRSIHASEQGEFTNVVASDVNTVSLTASIITTPTINLDGDNLNDALNDLRGENTDLLSRVTELEEKLELMAGVMTQLLEKLTEGD